MDKVSQKSKLSKSLKVGLAGAVVGVTLISAAPSFALTATGPIDQLKLETAKISGVYDLVVPTAVGSIVFSIGAVILKRVAFS